MADPAIVYISIGSNVGDRLETLLNALLQIHRHESARIDNVSNIYETEPVGFKAQADFLNGVAKISTHLTPIELLLFVQRVEHNLGRTRDIRWGPRTIDLDILLYEDRMINTSDLIIPHPELSHRRFVLKPLADIAADVVVPGLGKSVKDLLAETSDTSRIRLIKTSADVENKIFEV